MSYLREQRKLEEPGQRPVNHDRRLPFKGAIPQGEYHLDVNERPQIS
jgi:hypothetical protein